MARILIVDDEELLRTTVRRTLERASYTVDEAADGEAALTLLASTSFDAVLLDMRMPGLDGPETLTRIRAAYPRLPVIMVTGYGSTDSMQDVMSRGASRYIAKPFKNKELLATLSQLVNRAPVSVKKSRLWQMMLVGLVIAGGITFGLQHPQWLHPRPVAQDFALPYSNPTGLSWQGDTLWVLDWYTQSIYVHQVKGHELPILKTYHLPDAHVTGMAIVDGMLFTSNSWSKTISKHKLDNFLTVVETYPSPGPSPAALFWDGKYLWCGDLSESKIYQLQLANKLVVVGIYPAPGIALAGFYKDDNYAWTADSQTRRLYQHRLNDALTVIGVFGHDAFEKGAEPLSSFVWHDEMLWFSRDRQAVISRVPRAALKSQDMRFPPR